MRMHISTKWIFAYAPFSKNLQGVISGLSLETCLSNLKSIALTILNWSDWPVRCTHTLVEWKQYIRHSLRSLGGDKNVVRLLFKPAPPVGAGGGYMFSGRPSVPPSVRPSVIHVVVLCFCDISSICWRIFAKLLSLVLLGTQMTWLRFWVKRSKFKVTPSRRRRTATFSSWCHILFY